MSKYDQMIRGLRLLEQCDFEDRVKIEGDAIRSDCEPHVHAAVRLREIGWEHDAERNQWVFKCPVTAWPQR